MAINQLHSQSVGRSGAPNKDATDYSGLYDLWKHHAVPSADLPNHTSQTIWELDLKVLDQFGLGLEPTMQYLYQHRPNYEEFLKWVSDTGTTSQYKNESASGLQVLSADDRNFFEKHGYVVIRNSVTVEACKNTIDLICSTLEIDANDPDTWYGDHSLKQGIMIQLFQHPQLEQNRRSPIIRTAFEELWGHTNLRYTTDRVGFNPPDIQDRFYGTHVLHWDLDFSKPLAFGLQGILYLNDVASNQGAFTLVPGFHHQLPDFLSSLPKNANPHAQDLSLLGGAFPIAANAGDLIIWHHHLPHGSSANKASLPRWVQYINYKSNV